MNTRSFRKKVESQVLFTFSSHLNKCQSSSNKSKTISTTNHQLNNSNSSNKSHLKSKTLQVTNRISIVQLLQPILTYTSQLSSSIIASNQAHKRVEKSSNKDNRELRIPTLAEIDNLSLRLEFHLEAHLRRAGMSLSQRSVRLP